MLLSGAGLLFDTIPADIDEEAIKRAAVAARDSAETAAADLATAKARAVAAGQGDAWVIGADQILRQGDRWFDKPADLAAARDQLLALRGQTHDLVSAVCLVRGTAVQWSEVAVARLVMRDFSDAFLDAYLAREADHVVRSVGAYRLEGLGAQLFDRIDGDYFTVLGLPLLPLLAALRRVGLLGN